MNGLWETQRHMTRILWLLVIDGKLEVRYNDRLELQTRDITAVPRYQRYSRSRENRTSAHDNLCSKPGEVKS